MKLNAEDLLAQFQQDWPEKYETSTLRLLTEMQDQRIRTLEAENESLKAQQVPPGGHNPPLGRPYTASVPMPDIEDGGRHGG